MEDSSHRKVTHSNAENSRQKEDVDYKPMGVPDISI